jgi:hypothetical protein
MLSMAPRRGAELTKLSGAVPFTGAAIVAANRNEIAFWRALPGNGKENSK